MKAFQITIAGWPISLEARSHSCKIPEDCGMTEYVVTYGASRHVTTEYSSAAAELGSAIMHALACEGKIAND